MSTPLAELTTLRVGGVPRELVEARSREELVSAAERYGDELFVLGGGSNVLASDDPYEGIVLLVASRGIAAEELGERVVVRVQAGEPWDAFVQHAVDNGWAGLEALSGIPGTVGAAPIQNIGAYGAEVAEVLRAVEFFDFETGQALWLAAADLDLGYRSSVFKAKPGHSQAERRGLVLQVEFELERSALSAPVRYAQLATALGVAEGERLPLRQVRESVLALRAAKGMVLNEADPDSRSAGSFFINPIVSEAFARQLPAEAPRWSVEPDEPALVIPLVELAARAELLDQAPPATERHVKLSAAWLIENAGIKRGFALPGSRAAVSSKHTLALTNRGGATAAQLAELARYIQNRVLAEFGVTLSPEPVLLGVEL